MGDIVSDHAVSTDGAFVHLIKRLGVKFQPLKALLIATQDEPSLQGSGRMNLGSDPSLSQCFMVLFSFKGFRENSVPTLKNSIRAEHDQEWRDRMIKPRLRRR
jgi:hypothetical protein